MIERRPQHNGPGRLNERSIGGLVHRIFCLCQIGMSIDPIGSILLGSKFPKMVHGPISPHYLHAPNLAVSHWR